jgi:hypothetical protein
MLSGAAGAYRSPAAARKDVKTGLKIAFSSSVPGSLSSVLPSCFFSAPSLSAYPFARRDAAKCSADRARLRCACAPPSLVFRGVSPSREMKDKVSADSARTGKKRLRCAGVPGFEGSNDQPEWVKREKMDRSGWTGPARTFSKKRGLDRPASAIQKLRRIGRSGNRDDGRIKASTSRARMKEISARTKISTGSASVTMQTEKG